MKWTEEQLKAIELRDKSILVSAAAGSGKTAVLVERIKQILSNENIGLDEILVVTFTKAAASEMREKIVAAIPEQIDVIQKSHIGTFHSFALEIISRYFHLIDLEPGFSVCDDSRRILLKNEAIERLFEEKFESENPGFIEFLKMYGTSRSEDSVKAMISEVYDFIMSMDEPFKWLSNRIRDLALNEKDFKNNVLYQELMTNIKKVIGGAISNFSTVNELISSSGLGSLEPKAKKDLEHVMEIYEGFSESFEKGRLLLANRNFERFASSKDDKASYEQIKEQVSFLRDRAKDKLKKLHFKYAAKSLEEYLTEIKETREAALMLEELITDFHNIYGEIKRSKKLLDFSDIEHFALKILKHEEAVKEYKEKFKYIFVDEYQDSNLVQEALIQKIQRPDNVFMVGDVKQSIYKFRLAEPEIFMEKYARLKEERDPDGTKLDLNKNFRSKDPIIQGVNALFEYLMNWDIAGMDYDKEAALYKGVSYEGPLEHSLEFHLIDYDKAEDDDLGKTEVEAMLAASMIKQNKGLSYFDVKAGAEKRLDYKDMVILLRSAAGSAETFKEALEIEGIPAYVDAGDGYYDSLEISVFINLLKVIDNKNQDIPLLSVLRSAIFGLNMEEMAAIRGESLGTSYLKALQNYAREGSREHLKECCQEILLNISRWKKLQRHKPLKDFIWELMLKTNFYYYIGALPGGDQRQANLRALADKALAYENSQGKGLFGFINYIEAVKEKKIATAPVNLLGEGDNVVRIMTVHKSKGLEYPFVILGGLGKQFYREGGKSTSLHKELGLGLKHVNPSLSCYRKTLLQKLIDDRVEHEVLAEEIRILYVAMTRAQDKLILLGSSKAAEKLLEKSVLMGNSGIEDSKSYLEMVLPVYSKTNIVDFKIHQSKDIIPLVEEGKARMQIGDEANAKLANLVKSRLEWIYPHEEATLKKAKYSVSELSRKEVGKRLPIGEKVDSKATDRGLAYHKIVEHMPMDRDYSSLEQIGSFIGELERNNILSEDESPLIDEEKIMTLVQSPLFARMQKAEELHREAPFNLVRKQGKEKILIQGIIDAYFKEGDGLVLVDFKTDYDDGSKEREKALVDIYGPQIDLYKEALEKVEKQRVKEAYLYLLSSGKSLRII